jgi:hypothetical protein
MAISDRLREYLKLLMVHTFSHNELDTIALLFHLDPTKTTIKTRCGKYATEIPDDRFHELAEYVLNYEPLSGFYPANYFQLRHSFARALTMNGFIAEFDSTRAKYKVEPQGGLSPLDKQKKKVETLLTKRGFKEVQTDLDAAESHYHNGEYSQCLIMARKALEDLFSSMQGSKTEEERKKFLSRIQSKSARKLIKSIYGYGCKGHELSIPEYEAVFGYHLILSSIYFILILFK